MIYWLGEPLLYLCFAVIIGWLAVIRAGETEIAARIPKPFVIMSIIGISLLSFLPVLRIVLFFAGNAGFAVSLKNVLFTLAEGKAYGWTLLFCLLMLSAVCIKPLHISIRKAGWGWWLCCILCLGLAVATNWFSHMTANYGPAGLLVHLIHFLSVMIWSGILIAAGWFKPVPSPWSGFLRWFHILAMIAMTLIIGSGWLMSAVLIPQLATAAVSSYGKALLLKHLLIIPLLLFGFINGFLVKSKLSQDHSYQPTSWIRAEAVLVLAIYIMTGYMNQQATPESQPDPPSGLVLQGHPSALLYLGLAIGCLAGLMAVYRRNKKAYLALPLSLVFTLASYQAVMLFIS